MSRPQARRPLRLLAAGLLAVLATFPLADALVLSDADRIELTGEWAAPPGEDLVVEAPVIILDHAVLRAGDGPAGADVATTGIAVAGPGAPGGSIVLHG